MNDTAALLAELRDIVPPAEPSFWPPAAGWWLAAALAIAVIMALWLWIKWTLKHAARKDALRQLRAISDLPPQTAAIELSFLMRRAAMTSFPRSEVAGLIGQEWLEFLDRSGNTSQFSSGPGQLLADAPYQSAKDKSAQDCTAVITLCRQWVTRVM